MNAFIRKSGFTLTEVMMSAGILAIGFVLIAGAFPVGAKLTGIATERSIAAVTADEAFAKIQLYGLDMSYWDTYYVDSNPPLGNYGLTKGLCFDYSDVGRLDPLILSLLNFIPPEDDKLNNKTEYYYPTTNLVQVGQKKYHWSALCRRVDINKVHVTVFVSRLGGDGIKYPSSSIPSVNLDPAKVKPLLINAPEPYMIDVVNLDLAADASGKTLVVPTGYETYFREGSVILDDGNDLFDDDECQIYTIQERINGGTAVVLDRPWQSKSRIDFKVWVIPSAVRQTGSPDKLGGRWPCVGVFQRIIEF